MEVRKLIDDFENERVVRFVFRTLIIVNKIDYNFVLVLSDEDE